MSIGNSKHPPDTNSHQLSFCRKPKQWANSSLSFWSKQEEQLRFIQNWLTQELLRKGQTTQRMHLLPIDDKDSYSKSSFISKDKEMERIDYSQHMMKLRWLHLYLYLCLRSSTFWLPSSPVHVWVAIKYTRSRDSEIIWMCMMAHDIVRHPCFSTSNIYVSKSELFAHKRW